MFLKPKDENAAMNVGKYPKVIEGIRNEILWLGIMTIGQGYSWVIWWVSVFSGTGYIYMEGMEGWGIQNGGKAGVYREEGMDTWI